MLLAAPVFADAPSGPVTAGAYIPLVKRSAASVQTRSVALSAAPARFIALGPRNFNPAMRVSHGTASEPVADSPAIPASTRSAPHALSNEQAQQIISIFAPDQ